MSWRDTIKQSSWRDTIQEEKQEPTKLESAIEGAKEGASFGFLDELGAAMEGAGQAYLGVKGLGSPDLSEIGRVPEGSDPKYAEVYEQMLARRRGTQQEAREANPISFGAGAIGGGLLTASPGMAAGKAIGGLKGAAGVGAVEGGLQGLGSSEDKSLADVAAGAGIGAAIPAGLSGLGQAKRLLPGVQDSVTNKLVAKTSPARLMGAKSEDIEELLSNPELRRQMKATDVEGKIAELTPKLGQQIDEAGEAVGQKYQELQDIATPLVQAPKDIADPFKKMIDDNKGLYSNAAKGHVNSVDKILKGKMNVAKDMDEGSRLLLARRYLDNRVRDIKATPEDRQLYAELRKQLSQPLKEVPEMAEADKLYSEFKRLKEGVERPILDRTTKEVSPEKLSRVMRSQTLKGSDFMKSLGEMDQFIVSNPDLNKLPEVQTAIDSLADLKKTIEMGQLQGSLDRTGGPTGGAVNNLAQIYGMVQSQGLSLFALPWTNPMMWTRFVDAANEAGQTTLVKSIEKAAPAVQSAVTRQQIGNTQ